jgi:hypothetical protein
MTIKKLSEKVMKQAEAKGFGVTPEEISVAEKFALIHAQISAAYEGYRHKKMDGPYSFSNEMAGAIQRTIHLCGVLDIDVEEILREKFKENKDREWKWDKLNESHS